VSSFFALVESLQDLPRLSVDIDVVFANHRCQPHLAGIPLDGITHFLRMLRMNQVSPVKTVRLIRFVLFPMLLH
jgi:hypothetical protein